jgi:hypothetical protein
MSRPGVVRAAHPKLANGHSDPWGGKVFRTRSEGTFMSTITSEALLDAPGVNHPAAAEVQSGCNAMGLYAWIVVSLAILVTAALLGHVEDEQGARADDARTHSAVVARN